MAGRTVCPGLTGADGLRSQYALAGTSGVLAAGCFVRAAAGPQHYIDLGTGQDVAGGIGAS